jgi:glucose-6-phosphate 1-dehydrogenase
MTNKNILPFKKIDTPTTIIIIGVTGDLSRKKLLPALFDLHRHKALPQKFRIVGFSRRSWSDDEFRQFVSECLRKDRHHHTDKELKSFLRHLTFQEGNFDAADDFRALGRKLAAVDTEMGDCSNKLFHLAVPPDLYDLIFANMARAGLNIPCIGKNEGWIRLLVEKPFGKDFKTARHLDMQLAKFFSEEQIFRIDHYLAKDTIQNILAFRFSNMLFEPLWNSRYIEKVIIELYEIGDVAGRINFFEGVGELRDMGQSHALQMLAAIAMENPGTTGAAALRAARTAVLQRLVPFSKRTAPTSVVRAQYRGYRDEAGVEKKSQTETYVQLKVNLNSKRWRGTPFFIEAGKALHRSKVKIKIFFKVSEHCFACLGEPHEHPQNMLVFRVQPEEAIAVHFWAKKPGLKMELVKKELSFNYGELHNGHTPDAYEILLSEAIRGDQTLFASTDEIAASWKYITSVLKNWDTVPLQTYKKGSSGPKQKLIS